MISRCVVADRHSAPEYQFDKRGTAIFACPDCGTIMADVAYDTEQSEQDEYYTLKFPTLPEIEAEWGFRWRHILRRIRQAGGHGRLLDVGAGNGYFVAEARRAGFAAEGIEISEAEVAFARDVIGTDLRLGSLMDVQERFDIVTCFNVVEHVPEPYSFVAALVERVAPGGVLVITTPNPDCIHRRVKGLEGWGMVDPPHHLNLFPRRALESLLAPYEPYIERYETLSTYAYWARKLDGEKMWLRRGAFRALKTLGLGADHLLIARPGAR